MDNALAAYLQALTTRCEQATKGPWSGLNKRIDGDLRRGIYVGNPEHEQSVWIATVHYAVDVPFLAHARQDIPRLLDAVRVLRGALVTITQKYEDQCAGGEQCRVHDEARTAIARVEAMGGDK